MGAKVQKKKIKKKMTALLIGERKEERENGVFLFNGFERGAYIPSDLKRTYRHTYPNIKITNL